MVCSHKKELRIILIKKEEDKYYKQVFLNKKWYKTGYLFLFNSTHLIKQIPMQWDTQHKPKPSNPCNKNRIWKCLRTYVSQGTIYLGGRERMQKTAKC